MQRHNGRPILAVSASTPAGLTCTLPASVTFGSSPQTATLSCSATTAGQYTVTVTGTDGTLSHTTASILFHVVDFTIASGAVSPTQILVGASGTSTITVTAINGLTGTVNLAVSASTPAGLTCTLPASVTFGTSPQTATLSCSAATAGDYTVIVTGTDGTLSHMTATILFHVTDFTLTSSPSSISYTAPNTGTSTISANALNGFTGSISLAVTSVVPAGCTATISPASVTLPTPNAATLTAGCTGAVSFSVTITGTSGTLTRTVIVAVSPGGQDFSISASAVTPSQILAGASGTSTITVTSIGSFTGTVNLSVSASTPTGLLCGLTPTSVTFGTSPQTSTLSCSAATAGDYTVTVTGTSGGLTHTTSAILFHVVDFTISASAPAAAPADGTTTASSTVTVTGLNGFAGAVTLSATALAPLVCSVTPSSVTLPPSPQTSTVSCKSTSAGTFSVAITATSGSLSHSATATFNFNDFTISPSAAVTVNCTPGVTCTTPISASSVNGFAGSVSLTTSPSAGLTATLGKSVLVLSSGFDSTTLSLSAAANGDYTVTVTGTSGLLSHTTAVITLHVTTPDFTITASPASFTISVGGTGTSTITITPINGFSGTVSLTATVNPSTGLTASLSPTSIMMSGSSTLTVMGSLNGTYIVTVTGTSGTITHSTNVNVTVSGAQVSAPAFGQSNWKQRLQLSKNNFQQQWRFGLQNTDPSTTVYAQVQINVVDGAGFVPFTLTSSVITLAPNQLLTNLILTKTFTNADIGRSFSFQMVILWGTSPTSLTQQSTAAIGFVRTSGSFTILA
ncbi:hypothetical protein E6H14_02225 [Candidatus Bathyarchaeota archaeon]|nr:MAG: hypothetical protein E6H14_02225 [Candidatus Bathyarchaeota archaeon]